MLLSMPFIADLNDFMRILHIPHYIVVGVTWVKKCGNYSSAMWSRRYSIVVYFNLGQNPYHHYNPI